MEFQRFGDQYVLRLRTDDEVMATLIDFVRREQIGGGSFLAFGGFSRVRLRYFDMQRKEYRDLAVDRQVEVISLLGNIAWVGGDPKIHMHTAVGDEQGTTSSGHIGEGTVRPTLEVFLITIDGTLRREKDRETGLDLLALGP